MKTNHKKGTIKPKGRPETVMVFISKDMKERLRQSVIGTPGGMTAVVSQLISEYLEKEGSKNE